MKNLIDIESVSKLYNPSKGDREVKALDDISLRINYGEYVAIIGQSGSGKSTLMNILGCLDTPTMGKYMLDGENVSDFTEDRLSTLRNKQIGFIFQGFNLIPSLTALENVELPLIYRGMSREKRRELASEALKRVGLAHRLHHRPAQMSGGQQQRVAIARAIAARPPVILADEPTGNLDTRSGEDIIRILMELNSDGHTVILITHDPKIAKCASRVIKICDGKIV